MTKATVSSEQPRSTCQFCQSPAEHACSWRPGPAYHPAKWGEVKVGDSVRRASESPDPDANGRRDAVVEEVMAQLGPWRFVILVTSKSERRKELVFRSTDPVRILRSLPCGAPCCDLHARDLIGAVYCLQHWRAWEEVA